MCKKPIFRAATAFAIALLCCALPAAAQEQEASADEAVNAAESGGQPAADAGQPAAGLEELPFIPGLRPAKNFYTSTLRCLRAVGNVDVRLPGEDWKPIEENRYYPLGSSFRCGPVRNNPRPSSALFALGAEPRLSISNSAEFATIESPIGDETRTVRLVRGEISLRLPPTFTNDVFRVAADGFICKNVNGESRFDRTPLADGESVEVRVVTGSMRMEGLHFKIPVMRAANSLVARTLNGNLFTSLRGTGGIFIVSLDQGTERVLDTATGENKDVLKTLEYEFSPRNIIKIHRTRIPESERFIVCTMTFDSSGTLKNRCAFAEERYNINTGELVVQQKDKDALKAGEAAAVQEIDVPAIPRPGAQQDPGAAADQVFGAPEPAAAQPAEQPAPVEEAPLDF